jgi:hypothetical protein
VKGCLKRREADVENCGIDVAMKRGTCRLQNWGLRLASKKGHGKTQVVVARKTAVLLHRPWITGETYKAAA